MRLLRHLLNPVGLGMVILTILFAYTLRFVYQCNLHLIDRQQAAIVCFLCDLELG